jgi:hypothetical protein
MATDKFDRPSSTVITIPDPDNMPVSVHAEQGGTHQWRTDTHNYPQFKIRFPNYNPFNDYTNQTFDGSNVKPVVLPLKNVGNFEYTVQQMKEDGTCKDSGPFLFYVYPCKGCP